MPNSEKWYRKPGVSEWIRLDMPDDEEAPTNDELDKLRKQVKQANEDLRTTLLNSLQMQYLNLLAGSGCSIYANGPSMSKLWGEIVNANIHHAKSVAKKINYSISDENLEAFLSQLESAHFLHDAEIDDFLVDAKRIILEETSSFLSSDKIGAHMTLLHRLSRRRTRDQRLRVFTTNYDLCFEQAASRIGCIALDGFSFMAPRRYDPRYFDYDIIRRVQTGEDRGNYLEGVFLLYKLHGSVNWERTEDGIIEKTNPDPSKACLIYPASDKYQQSYCQPYIESISRYLSSIRQPNTCLLVIGFGFNDSHLSEPIVSAARSNPYLRIIIIDPQIKEKLSKCPNSCLRTLDDLSNNGEDIWLINEGFEEFANRIPDLQSLTPAENLLKDIKGLVHQ